MTVELNHLIVWCRDQKASANFLSEILGRPPPRRFFHFLVVELDNSVSLDFMEGRQVSPQHYAFLIDEPTFDAAFARIKARGVSYWADPARTQPNEINHNDGGRGLYFEDPDHHFLEILTRPYGSGG